MRGTNRYFHLRELIREAGYGSVGEFFSAHPSVPYHELTKRLGARVAPLGLTNLHHQDHEETGGDGDAYRLDVLARICRARATPGHDPRFIAGGVFMNWSAAVVDTDRFDRDAIMKRVAHLYSAGTLDATTSDDLVSLATP